MIWTALSRLARQPHLVALADQGVVSVASFLTLLLVARSSDAAELGVYALGSTVLGMAVAMQYSLVSHPYIILRNEGSDRANAHASAALAQSIGLSVLGLVALSALGLAFYLWAAPGDVPAIAWILAAVVPVVLIREFARDFAFAHLRPGEALALDATTALLQFLMLGWLAATGRMSAVSAFAALGLACVVTAAAWLRLAAPPLRSCGSQLSSLVREGWAVGKWLATAKLALLLQGYCAYWISTAVAGVTTTGIYAACMSVVGIANPLIFGLHNVLMPKSVQAWRQGGASGLLRRSLGDALLLGLLMAAFCVALLVSGEWLMRLLFEDGSYGGHGLTLVLLGLAAFASSLGLPANNALTGMARPRPVAAVTAASALLTCVLVWWGLSRWGLVGAAVAILAAQILGSLARWAVLLGVLRRSGW